MKWRLFRHIKNWFRFRIWDKHHVINIKTLQPGWTDKDEVLVHVMFQVLSDFMEKEKPAEFIDWNADPSNAKAWKEIQTLHRWWKEERPQRPTSVISEQLEIKYAEEDDGMMKRLIHVRKFLWT